jgi:hypothetical protein
MQCSLYVVCVCVCLPTCRHGIHSEHTVIIPITYTTSRSAGIHIQLTETTNPTPVLAHNIPNSSMSSVSTISATLSLHRSVIHCLTIHNTRSQFTCTLKHTCNTTEGIYRPIISSWSSPPPKNWITVLWSFFNTFTAHLKLQCNVT